MYCANLYQCPCNDASRFSSRSLAHSSIRPLIISHMLTGSWLSGIESIVASTHTKPPDLTRLPTGDRRMRSSQAGMSTRKPKRIIFLEFFLVRHTLNPDHDNAIASKLDVHQVIVAEFHPQPAYPLAAILFSAALSAACGAKLMELMFIAGSVDS